jgi:ribosomal protein L37AE/L43A
MNNPFKKVADISKETAKKWDNVKEEPSVQTVTCPQCAAPKPVNTNIATCAYCGFKFMDITVNIKPQRP